MVTRIEVAEQVRRWLDGNIKLEKLIEWTSEVMSMDEGSLEDDVLMGAIVDLDLLEDGPDFAPTREDLEKLYENLQADDWKRRLVSKT